MRRRSSLFTCLFIAAVASFEREKTAGTWTVRAKGTDADGLSGTWTVTRKYHPSGAAAFACAQVLSASGTGGAAAPAT